MPDHGSPDHPTRHPLAEPLFRELWSANVVSNIGSWMQTVGGSWLMTTLTTDTLPVALMQTATTLPTLLFGLAAGSLADRVDRRKLLLGTQTWMLVCAAALALLTLLGQVSPWLLLVFTFALGIGATLNGPTWSAILPDVVSRPQVPTAIIMNSAGYNVSRATGPAIGGFVVAAFGPAATFMVNAVSFLATLTVIYRWRPASARLDKKQSPDEPFVRTIWTGLQYAWGERPQRIVLARSSIWMLCASSFWGLLPLVARRQLGLEATGYGLLVTCFGGGAVLGSLVLPRLRRRWPTNNLLLAAIVTFASMLVVLAWVRIVPLVCVTLALGGWAWTSSNQNFQIAVQMRAPRWVQARAIAVAESSAGGLISAALLAVPGASAYYLGGGVVYTRTAREALLGIPDAALEGMRASTEAYALLLARTVRGRLSSTWAVAETSASGPSGNRYGDPAGHACLAVAGPAEFALARILATGSADRQANMRAFAQAALALVQESLQRTD